METFHEFNIQILMVGYLAAVTINLDLFVGQLAFHPIWFNNTKLVDLSLAASFSQKRLPQTCKQLFQLCIIQFVKGILADKNAFLTLVAKLSKEKLRKLWLRLGF